MPAVMAAAAQGDEKDWTNPCRRDSDDDGRPKGSPPPPAPQLPTPPGTMRWWDMDAIVGGQAQSGGEKG